MHGLDTSGAVYINAINVESCHPGSQIANSPKLVDRKQNFSLKKAKDIFSRGY